MKYVYRIVNALLGIGTFLCALFVDFFGIEISTGASLESVFTKLTNNNAGRVGVEEQLSIKRIIDIARGKDEYSFLFDKVKDKAFLWPKELNPLNTRIVVFLVAFAVILLCSLFVIIWSCCSDKRTPVLAAGVLSLAAAITLIVVFKSMATDIADGTINMTDVVLGKLIGENSITQLIGNIAGNAVVFIFTLCGAQNTFIMISVALIIWTVMFYLVDLGEPKENTKKVK